MFKTRKGKLSLNIKNELSKDKPDLKKIIEYVDEYEKNNIDSIEKLKKEKKLDLDVINGALKMCINDHGPITKVLIGSASKRIYGSLMINPNFNERMRFRKISLRDLVIGVILGIFLYILFV